MKNRSYMTSFALMAVVLAPAWAHAQRGPAVTTNAGGFTVMNVESAEDVPTITGAPFSAEATTEFTQILADGNRIERRSSTTIARDGHGRTRREQELTLVGPLTIMVDDARHTVMSAGGRGVRVFGGKSAAGQPPRFIVITDPAERVSYTLDDQRKEARINPMPLIVKRDTGASELATQRQLETELAKKRLTVAELRVQRPDVVTPTDLHVESLGTRQIEGVAATGVRTTTTIPAGEIGNLLPIDLVTERWFSDQLGMAVLITRHDPRSGDTAYRLTSIVRSEPPPDLFTVPTDYRVVDLRKQVDDSKARLEEMRKMVDRLRKAAEAGPQQ